MTEDKTPIYVVYCNHYMGMDGDYKSPIAAYTKPEYAERKRARLEIQEDHIGHEYDTIYYTVEEVELVH